MLLFGAESAMTFLESGAWHKKLRLDLSKTNGMGTFLYNKCYTGSVGFSVVSGKQDA